MGSTDFSSPNRQLKMVTISAPNGAAGCWIVDTMASNIESGINSLKGIINNDKSQNFYINCSKLEDALLPDTENVSIYDDELRFISPEYIVIAPINEDKCIRNVDLMSKVIRQCILSPSYYEYVIKVLENRCADLDNGELNVRNTEPEKYMLCSAYKTIISDINTAVSAITGCQIQLTSV